MTTGLRRVFLVLAAATVALAVQVAGATAAQPKQRVCAPIPAKVTAGKTIVLKLNCRPMAGSKKFPVVIGKQRRLSTRISVRPRLGTLGKLARKTGTVRYKAKLGSRGRDLVRYVVRAKNGWQLRGRIVITVRPATPITPIDPEVPVDPEVPDDGLPPVLPEVPGSVGSTTKAWQPTAYDTCSQELHDRFSVIGPDGRKYPTWHPPTITDPATDQPCSFGHEHGTDPRTSDIYDWVATNNSAPEYEKFAGIPFGLAAESLHTWAELNGGLPTRSEDNVGYKVDVANDVKLLANDGDANGVTCDFLTLVHQGSHSPDALSNNAHELLYATRCDDGTEVISSTVSRFGDPGYFNRSCDPSVAVTTVDNGYPLGGGSRLIPDRTCIERDVLVPAGRTMSSWALYEKWSSENQLTDPEGEVIASFPVAFGVFNPARYGAGGATSARTLPLCWETAANGDKARGVDCRAATQNGSLLEPPPWDQPGTPFAGTKRDFYLWGTEVKNEGGSGLVWTDPYGGNAQSTPFPGAVCQLVSTLDNGDRGAAKVQVLGRGKDFVAEGVHAPN